MNQPFSYPEAAARHLRDAQNLMNLGRWDNAVYHAGYVVECAFKTLVTVYVMDADGKAFGHDLETLQGRAVERLRVMYPAVDGRLPVSRTENTQLAQDHPVRRYFSSGRWSERDARLAIRRAAEIYDEIIPPLLLDGLIAFSTQHATGVPS